MSADLAVIEAALKAAMPGPWSVAAGRIVSKLAIDAETGCWLWSGYLRDGYGVISIHCVNHSLHRLIFQALKGEIPNGLEVDHICRRRACCNPDHLRAVTRKQNAENLDPSPNRGVRWNPKRAKWEVTAKSGGRSYFGGRFTDIAEARSAAAALRNRLFTHNTAERGAA